MHSATSSSPGPSTRALYRGLTGGLNPLTPFLDHIWLDVTNRLATPLDKNQCESIWRYLLLTGMLPYCCSTWVDSLIVSVNSQLHQNRWQDLGFWQPCNEQTNIPHYLSLSIWHQIQDFHFIKIIVSVHKKMKIQCIIVFLDWLWNNIIHVIEIKSFEKKIYTYSEAG